MFHNITVLLYILNKCTPLPKASYQTFLFTFSHLADTFIQSDLQMRTMEAIKINKRAMICKCYDKCQLA